MGGTVRTVLNTANYLANKNYSIEIISLFRRQNTPFFHVDPRVKITILHDVYARDRNRQDIRTKIANFLLSRKSKLIHKDEESIKQFSLLTDIKLFLYLRSIKEGVLVSTRPCFNLFISKFGRKKIKLVGQEHINFEGHPEGLKKSIKKYYPKLDYLITLTDKDNEHYQKIFNRNSNLQILKITNSVSANQEVYKSSLKEKTVIAAGRLDYIKGYDLLIEAFSYVVKKNPDWKLKIYGTGKEKNELMKLIQDRHLYNHVFLMGPTKNLNKELLNSSIFAVSSRIEGFGLVIVESMQSGVPVVSFDCPHGPSEIITNEVDGILVDNENVLGLANSINLLVEDNELRGKMGLHAIESVKRFSIESIGAQWDEFFKSIFININEQNHKIDSKTLSSNSSN